MGSGSLSSLQMPRRLQAAYDSSGRYHHIKAIYCSGNNLLFSCRAFGKSPFSAARIISREFCRMRIGNHGYHPVTTDTNQSQCGGSSPEKNKESDGLPQRISSSQNHRTLRRLPQTCHWHAPIVMWWKRFMLDEVLPGNIIDNGGGGLHRCQRHIVLVDAPLAGLLYAGLLERMASIPRVLGFNFTLLLRCDCHRFLRSPLPFLPRNLW